MDEWGEYVEQYVRVKHVKKDYVTRDYMDKQVEEAYGLGCNEGWLI